MSKEEVTHEAKPIPRQAETPAPEAKRSLLHPGTGALILGLDWLLFSGVVFTGGAGLPASIALGLLGGGLGAYLIQTRQSGDTPKQAIWKSALAATAVALPFPVAGTFVGGGIVLLSGLNAWRDRLPLPK